MWMFHRPLTGIGVMVAQVLRAAHRSDLPSLINQDPSGVFGPETLPPLRIVVLGDSSVTSPGVEPLSASWPQQVAAHLADRYRVELESVAVGGSKARDVLRVQLEPAIGLAPDIALVSVGANDALRGTPVRRFEAELDLVVARLAEATPRVGLSGVGDLGTIPRLPVVARAAAGVRGRSIDGAIRRVAARHPGVVKSRAWGEGWEAFASQPEVIFAGDQFHAGAAGHAVFAVAMIAVVDALLAAPTGKSVIA
jgi:lysophospholipase L1-like esterase